MLPDFARRHGARIPPRMLLLLLAGLPLACGNAPEPASVAIGGASELTFGGSRNTGGTGAVVTNTGGNDPALQSAGGTTASGGAALGSSSGGTSSSGGANGLSSGGATAVFTGLVTGGSPNATGGSANNGSATMATGGSNGGAASGGNSNSANTSTTEGGTEASGGTSSFTGGTGAVTGGSTSTTTTLSLPGVTATRPPLELTQTDDFTAVPFAGLTQMAQFGPNGSTTIPITDGRIRFLAQCQPGNCEIARSVNEACFLIVLLSSKLNAQVTLTATDASDLPTGFDWRTAGATGLTLKYDVRDNGGNPVSAQVAVTASGASSLWLTEVIGSDVTTNTLQLSSLPEGSSLDSLDITLSASAGQMFTFCIDDLGLDPPVQSAEYVASSELLTDADYVRDYVKGCAEFWSKTRAPKVGFYSNIDRTGAAIDTEQYPLSQWRLTYGFTRAFMLSGDERYLQLAEVALPLDQPTAGIGVPRTTEEWAYDGFEHNYSKVGLMAYCEATREPSTCARVVVDALPPASQQTDFNTVVDAFTTHLISLRLVRYDDPLVQVGFRSWTEALLANLSAFSSKEEWYVMKLAWTLMRVALITGDSRFSDAARGLLRPFGSEWTPLGSAGLEWWPMEEFTLAPLLGYMMFGYQPERKAYLRAADGTARDYAEYFIDPEYGEVYIYAGAAGALDSTKGTQYKSGYHSIEYGYFVYVYSSLFLRHQPFTLYYRFVASEAERDLVLTPIAIGDNQLRIKSVTHAGEPYLDFSPSLRSLHLSAAASGVFAVTFEGTEL